MKQTFKQASKDYPYPIARACSSFLDCHQLDPWKEWELLSSNVLQPILKYLSHLLLSDLVAMGHKPNQLFHRIQSILSRPLAGHYVGFLRETARYYKNSGIEGGITKLVDYIYITEISKPSKGEDDPLLGTLVDYRNLFAHGRIANDEVLNRSVERIRDLTTVLLKELYFLTDYPLASEDGTILMGSALAFDTKPQPLVVISAGEIPLRPLLLKLKGKDLALLEHLELSKMQLAYRGNTTFERFTKKKLKTGDGARIFNELKALIDKVRAIDATLPQPEWSTFIKRAAVATQRTLSHYNEMGKFKSEWFIPRPAWHGNGSVFEQFLTSDKVLLAINGRQGTGKSALVSHLVDQSSKAGHAVLFVNGQRFSFAAAAWTGNPFPQYFSQRLHYEAPFNKRSSKRILKGAPPGKQLIIFIDAINEVDGIEQKWNRFRAMELMLEWIMEIAQPGLKIVISFRLDTYEEFEYLQDDEIPEGLIDVSFGGNNPSKPWVYDLEVFDNMQAQALYDKLQKQPQYGMAPAMAWDKLEQGLGDQVNEYITNPLIFMVFLRAHHGEKTVFTNDKEKMFERYAGKLTGTLEASRQPWYYKVWPLIRNGNVTQKEQFLLDIVDKIAEEGGPSFLIERLMPKRSKRDRRLANIINAQQDQTYQNLKESGLIVEEKIELQEHETTLLSRRVTFIGELMIAAMDGVSKKIVRKIKIRSNISDFIFALIAIVLLLVIVNFLFKNILIEYYVATKGFSSELAGLYGASFSELVNTLILYFSFLGLILIISNRYKLFKIQLNIKEIGLIQKAVWRSLNLRVFSLAQKLFLYFIIPITLLYFILFTQVISEVHGPNFVYFLLAISPLFAAMVSLVVVFFTHRGYFEVLRQIGIHSPARVVKITAQRVLIALNSGITKEEKWKKYFQFIIIISLAIGLVVFTAFFLCNKDIRFSPAYSISELKLSNFNKNIIFPIYNDLWKLLLTTGISISLFLILSKKYISQLPKYKAKHLIRHPILTPKKYVTAKVLIFCWSIVLLSLLAIGTYYYRISQINDLSLIKRLNISSDEYSMNNNQVIALDINKIALNSSIIRSLYKFSKLKELTLPNQKEFIIDFTKFSELDKLSTSAISINDISKLRVRDLTVYDPESWLEKVSNNHVEILRIKGKCVALGNISQNFNKLTDFHLNEQAARILSDNLLSLSNNVIIRIETEASPILDWFTFEHTGFIISTREPIDISTRNIKFIERLHTPADSLNPELLRKAEFLKWLLLKLKKNQTSEWYKSMLDVVKTSLPKLNTLEIMVERKLDSLYTARGKNEAIDLLNLLIDKPKLIGQIDM